MPNYGITKEHIQALAKYPIHPNREKEHKNYTTSVTLSLNLHFFYTYKKNALYCLLQTDVDMPIISILVQDSAKTKPAAAPFTNSTLCVQGRGQTRYRFSTLLLVSSVNGPCFSTCMCSRTIQRFSRFYFFLVFLFCII